jgi:RNAse (barnase) inhibitor barstar
LGLGLIDFRTKEEQKKEHKLERVHWGFTMLFKSTLLVLPIALYSLNGMASGTVSINGKDFKTRDQLQTHIAKELNFSHFYGKTLDSLYDALSTDNSSESIIKIKHVSILKAKLGTIYVDGMVDAIRNAAEDNPKIILVIE